MIMMKRLNLLPASGWRRTGTLNLILILCYGLMLLICLIISVSRRDSSLLSTTTMYEGDCKTIHNLNLFFHLLLNILSTLIMASSGFFMQILCSPSRKEIDYAHSHFRSLEIGVSSIKNLRFVSTIKKYGCFALFFSSVPIHLLFNSSIFDTKYKGSEWGLTIASETFATREVIFFPPGASLANAGAPCYKWDELHTGYTYDGFNNYLYGGHVPLVDYWNRSSSAYRNITNTANESRNWRNITTRDCLAEYASCKPRNDFRDVVIVVDTGADSPNGWTRSQVFHDPHNELGPIWDSHVPRDDINSLWYSTKCLNGQPTSPIYAGGGAASCYNSCAYALGMDLGVWGLLTNTFVPSESNWTITFNRPGIFSCSTDQDGKLGINNQFNTFNVKYCLAEPSPNYTCRIGLSNILFFATTVCVFIKVITCFLVLCYIPYTSLVTLGDALESFIVESDPATVGLGTFSFRDSCRIQFEARHTLRPEDSIEFIDKIQPRIWHRGTNRLVSALPKSVWFGTFLPVMFLLGVGVHFASQMVYEVNGGTLAGAFGESESPLFLADYIEQHGYFIALLVANLPQLILSYCFFSYTSVFTRMANEMDFNSYSLAPHKPLRVSYPAGEQVATYWLQLPYPYSVPLLIISALLHWLASNSMFIFASQGGYLVDSYHGTAQKNDDNWGIFKGAVVVLGVSPSATLTFLVASFVLAFVPILYGLRKLPGEMVVGACDSLVLSAACHPYVHVPAPQEVLRSRSNSEGVADEVSEREALRELSKGKLRWGVTTAPPELVNMTGTDQRIKHLSFSGEEEFLSGPVYGCRYA